MLTIEQYLPELAKRWETSMDTLGAHWSRLQECGSFLTSLNAGIVNVPEFAGVRFAHVSELRVYRCFLYLFVRTNQPSVMIETGVHNGLSSAFILLAMEHNRRGTLVSVDMPPLDARMMEQGTRPLPVGKSPGWLIPDACRQRHRLLLGPAEKLLPKVYADYDQVDAFLHDSDHAYAHMMFEMGLSWRFLRPGGWLLADNVEQNRAFAHFAEGVGADGFTLASFDEPNRCWRHGMLRKAGPLAHEPSCRCEQLARV